MIQITKQQKQIYQHLSHINYHSLQSFQSTLQDHHTLNSYISAITQNQSQFIDKIVLHLTSGCNCLYSIIAAQMGANKVYCVVNGKSQIQKKNIYMMNIIIKENGYQDIIQVKSFQDFNAQIQIIIGQPMGYNMIYDGLLDRIVQSRDLYMKDKQKGLIFPNKLHYKCAFINDQYYIQKKTQFWNEVYGIPMLSIKNSIFHQPIIRSIDPLNIVSEAVKFIDIDLMKITYSQLDTFYNKFIIKTPINTSANGLTIWFQIQFRKSDGNKIQIKASPWYDTTKWAQMTLYTEKEWELSKGSQKIVQFFGKKNHIEGITNIKIKVDGKNQQSYILS